MFDTIKNQLERWHSTRQMERKGQIGTRKRRTSNNFADAAEHSRVVNIFMLMLLWVVCSLLLLLAPRDAINLEWDAQTRAPHPVFVATPSFEYEDRTATEEKIAEAVKREPVILQLDSERQGQIVERFRQFFYNLTENPPAPSPETPADGDAEAAARRLRVLTLCHEFIARDNAYQDFFDQLAGLLRAGILSGPEMAGLQADAQLRIDEGSNLHRNRLANNLATPEQAAEELAGKVLADADLGGEEERAQLKTELSGIFAGMIGDAGNLSLDVAATEALQAKATEQVRPVWRTLERGAMIVAGGALLTDADRDCLAQYQTFYNQNIRKINLNREILSNAGFCFLLVLFVALYLHHMHPDIIRSNRMIFLFGAIVLLSLVINYLYIRLFYLTSEQFGISPRLIYSVVPVLLASVLLAVTMGLRAAMGGGFFVAVITAQMLRMTLTQALITLVICTLAGLAVRRASNYRSLFLRTFGLLLLNWVLDGDVLRILSDQPADWRQLVIVAGISTFSGAMLVLPLLFVLELVFNVSTNMSLLVMCDFNHPLLKELHLRAPGTSMHAQNVAILAENAAKAIEANPLKARAGALYHDIGKIVNPEYFTENNIDTANQHTALTPRMSSIIIMNHVKDGLDMALKYKLCRVVRDAIAQHHGTDLLHFFQAARQGEHGVENLPVEKDYRYPGPLPSDPEIVIVGLADACEAYCRSLEKPTPSKIGAAVDEIFSKRMADGQLDHARLTIAELARIRDSFIRTLTTMHHNRIAYKKTDRKNENDLHLENAPASPSPAPGAAATRETRG